MPHIIVKLYPGKSEQQKTQLAAAIVKSGMEILNHGDESFSVAFEEIPAGEWKAKYMRPISSWDQASSIRNPATTCN